MTTPETTTRTWLRSFSNLAVGEGVTGVMRFVALLLCARALGVSNFGFLNVGLVIGAYLVVAHAGLEVVGTRDIAARPEIARTLAADIVSLRLAIATAVYAGTVVVTLLMPLEAITRDLILVFGLSLFTSAFDVRWIFVGMERTAPVAVAASVTAAGYLAGIAILVRRREDVLFVPVLQILSEALLAALLVAASHRRIGRWWPRFTREARRSWRPAFHESLPIAAGKAARGLTLAFDIVLIGLLRPPADVGQYGAARRLMMVVLVFLGLYTNAFLPLVARAVSAGREGAIRVISLAARRTAVVVVPCAVVGTVWAPLFLRYLVGEEYTAATNVLRVLIWSMVVTCFAGLYAQMLLSYHQQKRLLAIDVVAAVSNIVLNLALIPALGLIGAAIAALSARALTLAWTIAAARPFLSGTRATTGEEGALPPPSVEVLE